MLHFRDLSSWNHKTLGISFSCTGANQSGKKGTVLKVVGTDHCSPLISPLTVFSPVLLFAGVLLVAGSRRHYHAPHSSCKGS